MFRDQFTDFSYNGISSKDMKVWITNDHDLTENIVPEMNDQFIAPSYIDGRYYAGTSINKSSIVLKCIAINITVQEKRKITNWLDPKTSGKLVFGNDPYHYYDVKVSKAISASKWIKSRYDKVHGGYLYIYEFTIEFSTIQDWAKLGNSAVFDIQFIKAMNNEFDDTKEVNPYKDLFTPQNDEELEKQRKILLEQMFKEYMFNNSYNEYEVAQFLRNNYCFLLPGLYKWADIGKLLGYRLTSSGEVEWRDTVLFFLRINKNDYKTNNLPYVIISNMQNQYILTWNEGMQDVYGNNLVLENQDYLEVFYPCIVDNPIERGDSVHTSYSEKAYSVLNIGSLPMNYNYFLSGRCSNEEESIYTMSIDLNDENQYRTGIQSPYQDYFYNFSIDSQNGVILNNGDFCQNAKDSTRNIHLDNYYHSIGSSTIPPGHPEISNFSVNTTLQPYAYFKSSREEGPLRKYNITESPIILSVENPLVEISNLVADRRYVMNLNTDLLEETINSFSITASYDKNYHPDDGDQLIIEYMGNREKNSISFVFKQEDINDYPDRYNIIPGKDILINIYFIDKTGKKKNDQPSFISTSFTVPENSSKDMKIIVNKSFVDYNKDWFSWSYVTLDMPNNFNFIHDSMVHLSFFNKKQTYSSAYSINTDFVPQDFTLDPQHKDIMAYAIPYVNEKNNKFIRFVFSPADFEKVFDLDFVNKVVVENGGRYELQDKNYENNKWCSNISFPLVFNKYFSYLSIGDANKIQIGNKEDVKGSILNESIIFQSREV